MVDDASQARECLHTYSDMLGGVAYCSAGELAGILQEKAHSLNMASLANRRSAAQLCSHLAAGEGGELGWGLNMHTAVPLVYCTAEQQVMMELRSRWEGEVVRWRERVLSDVLSRFK